MTSEQITAIVVAALKRVAPDTDPATLGPDDNYRSVLDIDSFDTLRFIVEISEKLHVDIPEADYGSITTSRTLTDYLSKRVGSSQ